MKASWSANQNQPKLSARDVIDHFRNTIKIKSTPARGKKERSYHPEGSARIRKDVTSTWHQSNFNPFPTIASAGCTDPVPSPQHSTRIVFGFPWKNPWKSWKRALEDPTEESSRIPNAFQLEKNLKKLLNCETILEGSLKNPRVIHPLLWTGSKILKESPKKNTAPWKVGAKHC